MSGTPWVPKPHLTQEMESARIAEARGGPDRSQHLAGRVQASLKQQEAHFLLASIPGKLRVKSPPCNMEQYRLKALPESQGFAGAAWSLLRSCVPASWALER